MAEVGREQVAMATIGGQTPDAIGDGSGIDAAGGTGAGPLAVEIDYYSRHVDDWGQAEGQYVLVHGREHHGFHPTRDQALLEGLRRFGRVPFLVKRVDRDERPRSLGAVLL